MPSDAASVPAPTPSPSPIATGRIFKSDDALYDLTLTRTLHATPGAVWESLTKPSRTAEWIGPWRGAPGAGQTIHLQMIREEGDPWVPVRIEDCEPPHLLAFKTGDETGGMELQIRLTARNGDTELTFVQHLEDPTTAESMGPGWEYYLDMLIAARDGLTLPDFGDYYPSQAEHFRAEAQHALSR